MIKNTKWVDWIELNVTEEFVNLIKRKCLCDWYDWISAEDLLKDPFFTMDIDD